MGHFAWFFEGAETFLTPNCPESSVAQGAIGLGPLEKPQEMPRYMFCPRQKCNFQDFQNQRYISIFMSQRERERERERGKTKRKGRERESTKALVILFLNRLAQTEKSANYTVLCGKSGIVCSQQFLTPRGSQLHTIPLIE